MSDDRKRKPRSQRLRGLRDCYVSLRSSGPRGGYRYPLNNAGINGSYYGTVFGATIPAPIWREAMIGAHDGLPYKDFGGEPKSGWVNLDLGSGNAKVENQGQGQNEAPAPAPAPAA